MNHHLHWMVSRFERFKTGKECSLVVESNNLLEDLHIPDSRLIDGDAAELALIGKSLSHNFPDYICIDFQ